MPSNGYDKLPSSPCDSERPKRNDNWFSTLSFGWMNNVFKTGNVRTLEHSDLFLLDEENKSKMLTEQLQEVWEKEKKTCMGKTGKTPRLWKSVLKSIPFWKICLILTLGILETICEVIQPLLLGIIVSQLMSSNDDRTLMYLCAVFMPMVAFGRGLSLYHRFYQSLCVSTRRLASLMGAVYCKLQRVSLLTIQDFTEGQVIDLVANDVQTMDTAFLWLFECIHAFISLPAMLFVLTYFFGWMALIGVLFLFALIPLLFLIASFTGKLRGKIALVSDQRLSAINEMVLGIRAVKTHAWESNYKKMVIELRRREISIVRKRAIASSIVEVLYYTSTATATFITVLSLSLTGHPIQPDNGFMLLAFMFAVSRRVAFSLGRGLQTLSEAFISLSRIEKFLNLEDLASIDQPKNSGSFSGKGKNMKIHLGKESKPGVIQERNKSDDTEHVLFQPSRQVLSLSEISCKLSAESNTLHEISFETPINSLTVITGPVGSGKSTLLSSIAGEVKLSGGTVSCQGTVAYVPQIPWIFSGTLQENILFGESYNQEWFSVVIEACSLGEDMERFPDGVQCVVGERGVALSGGQKARVSLARAVYGRSDVYLLDDPLSAVDIKVSEQIFEKCIFGLLSDRIRVMASNQTKHMENADLVVVLEGGRILAKGTFSELAQSKILSTLPPGSNLRSLFKGKEFLNYAENETTVLNRNEPNECTGLAISEEDRVIGDVSLSVYWDYFRAALGPVSLLILISLYTLSQVVAVSPDLWLSRLTKQSPEMQRDSVNLGIYAGLIGASLLVMTVRALILTFTCVKSSENLHNDMVKSILHAPVYFFDTNPAGRILNRFSKDIGGMDRRLPESVLITIQYILFVFAAALIPAFSNFWLLFVLVPLVLLLVFLCRYYLRTSRDLTRLQAISQSPVFSHFSDSLNGLDSIRTRGRQNEFIDQLYRHQDAHNEAVFMKIAGERWFASRTDVLTTIFIAVVALSVVSFSLDTALAGISLVYVNQLITKIQGGFRQFSDVENLMTSVERVIKYCQIEPEPGYKNGTAPPCHWPKDGQLTFSEVFLTYYPGGPQVLSNLNFSIQAKAKIGVIGRTGAGKSSFVAAILRMPDADGEISIDGVKLKDINLQESRRCISVLNQEPLLFSGTLKKNLDPLGQHDDSDLWAALHEVQLKPFVENLDGKLDYKLAERGNNLSVGERQLICLARTLLQHNKIVILDEPTAHVDPVTEETIWNTVHEKLKDCTVITIAHRLSTIRDCDMILVFRDGQIAEFGRFDTLSGSEGSVSTRMVEISDLH